MKDDHHHSQHVHVHFDADSENGHEHTVQVKNLGSGVAEVDLGLLQINHRYQASFHLPKSLVPEDGTIFVDDTQIPNKNCRVLNMLPPEDSKDGLLLKIELITYKDKNQEEEVLFTSPHGESLKKLVVKCRVLGKGKGTPSLRNGIHSIETLADPNESDNTSDWQGFEEK